MAARTRCSSNRNTRLANDRPGRYGTLGQDKLEMDRSIASFGRALRALRVANHLTQEELAHRCFLRHDDISQIERGVKAPNLMRLLLIADGLGVSVQTLTEEVLVPRREDSTRRALALVDAQPGISIAALTQSLALPESYVKTLARHLQATGQVVFGRTQEGLTVRRTSRA